MSKHTPGPWHWHTGRTLQHLHDAGGKSFALVSMPAADRVDINHIDQYEANARLIAAAPELYEALREAHEFLPLIADQRAARVYEKARAALLKASPDKSMEQV